MGAPDLELVRGWLRQPHVSRWWGDPDQSLAAVSDHPPADHALICLAGQPVGYVLWRRLSREEIAEAGLAGLPPDHVDVDILIGEPEAMGRGVGPCALLLVLARLGSIGVSSVGLGTSRANQRARRAFEKADFRLFREFEEGGRAMCYLIREPAS
ncbi:MAG: acetyltransferase [Gemmatimonadetes bacterium]|nr:acetyltransferase [Gemmatimonadota bacterium]